MPLTNYFPSLPFPSFPSLIILCSAFSLYSLNLKYLPPVTTLATAASDLLPSIYVFDRFLISNNSIVSVHLYRVYISHSYLLLFFYILFFLSRVLIILTVIYLFQMCFVFKLIYFLYLILSL